MTMVDGTIHLSAEQMGRFEDHFARTPRYKKLRELILEYTQGAGGA